MGCYKIKGIRGDLIMSNQVLGFYINDKSEIKKVVQTKTDCISYVESSSNDTTLVKVCQKKENIQVVQELTPHKHEGFVESEEFELYPNIDALWISFKVEEK